LRLRYPPDGAGGPGPASMLTTRDPWGTGLRLQVASGGWPAFAASRNWPIRICLWQH